ncbi:MAG: hypothetical protein JJ863_28205 [Deltaproteobacteria bacterium]|nr:hypothetical protein [Deltaproteobacteria bacterium]
MPLRLCLLFALLAACGDDGTGTLSMDAAAPDAAMPTDAGPTDAATDAAAEADGSAPDAFVADGGASIIDRLLEQLMDPTASADDAAALVRGGAWTHGWPVREAGRWLFVTRQTDVTAWVGDANGWVTDANPTRTDGSGTLRYALVETDADPAGSKYKWFAPVDVYAVPLEATAYGYDEFGEHGWVAPPTDAPYFERFPDLTTSALPTPRTVRARVPAGGPDAASRVLLLHDGQNVFDPDAVWGGWRVDEALTGEFAGVLAVSVDNAPDRMNAYTHTTDTIGGSTVGGAAADYLALLEDEVLPFVRTRYGVAAAGDSLMVAGSSLGGLVSLYIGNARPTLAGCIGAMSSTLGWGAFVADGSEALITRFTERPSYAIYLDSGGNVSGGCVDTDGDGVDEDSDDSDNYCTTLQLRDHLLGLGAVSGTDLVHWWEPGAPHNEAAWRDRVPRMLEACAAMGWAR